MVRRNVGDDSLMEITEEELIKIKNEIRGQIITEYYYSLEKERKHYARLLQDVEQEKKTIQKKLDEKIILIADLLIKIDDLEKMIQ
jgi:hypothetical protein